MNDGYFRLSLFDVDYNVHIVVYELHHGSVPAGKMLDHKDGDRSNNKIGNLRLVDSTLNARNKIRRHDNVSGTTGVSQKHRTKRGEVYSGWVAQWSNLDGTRGSKYFMGLSTESFQAAVNFRKEKMKELNEQYAGYTDRHLEGGTCAF
jgi:hypothetical protein